MDFLTNHLRPAHGGYAWHWGAACVVAAAALAVVGTQATASLILPQIPEFTLKDLAAPQAAGAAQSSRLAPARQPAETVPEQPPAPFSVDNAFTPGGSSTGSSTSGSGTSGVSVSALAIGAAVVMSEPTLAGWISGEHRLALPMPPGNNLLRPPRAV